ncbi:MAG: LTA synthase family protein [Clostridia bacterium]|nr:LTA synthase family protein [Clostridia bacterium]
MSKNSKKKSLEKKQGGAENQAPEGILRTKKQKTLFILHIILVSVCAMVFALGIYYRTEYPDQLFEQVVFYGLNGGTQPGETILLEIFEYPVQIMLLVTAVVILLQYDFFHKKLVIGKTEKSAGVQVYPIRRRKLFTAIVCVLLVVVGLWLAGVFSYIYTQTNTSDFIESEYVRPQDVELKTPEKKRNLLLIEVESLETTMFTEDQGGIWDHEVIPEMYELLFDEDAIFFASDRETRGMLNGFGTTWTTASIIANTSGVPFKVPAEQNNAYKEDNFMRGAYTLGDILKNDGYRNVLIDGCRTSFGGVKQYFTRHGSYEIVDVNSVDDFGLVVPQSQVNEWGFSDEVSCLFAKEIMTRLDEEGDGPWHLFISTIDTHFNGYLYEADPEYGCKGSVRSHPEFFENVYATTSRDIGDLISWVKQQPFYEDTTIVIVGDHVNMKDILKAKGMSGKLQKERARYNLIINSVVTTEDNKRRDFTSFDFYPTILAAMGYEITGDRLGLGVNLFSDCHTLAEIYGIDYMNRQIEMRSNFYIDELIGRDHYEWLEKKSKDEGN